MLAVVPSQGSGNSIFDIGARLALLLKDAEAESIGGQLNESVRERAADLVEAMRRQVVRKPDRDLRSLFDLDERLIDLMDRAEEQSADNGTLSEELATEITDYLEAFRSKVDRIVGYWRWQETVAEICGRESERLAARKRAADARVTQLKGMLQYFMQTRGLKKLEGEKASIGHQTNGMASLVVDDPTKLGEEFFDREVRLSRDVLSEVVKLLPECDARRRLEALRTQEGWEVNSSAVRAALANNRPVEGARLVKGSHVRIR
jgi:hypothetical protein